MLPLLYEQALQYTKEGDFVAALAAWEEHYQSLLPRADVMERYFVHYYLADALGENGQAERSIQLLKEALQILPAEEDGLLLSTQVEICRFLMIEGRFAEADKIRGIFWSDLLQENRFYEAYHTAADKYDQNPKEGDELFDEVIKAAVEARQLEFLFHYYRDHAAHLLSQKRFAELVELSQEVRSSLLADDASEDFQSTIIFTCLNELEVYYQRQEYVLLKERLIHFWDIMNDPQPEEKRIITLTLFYKGIDALIDEDLKFALELFERAQINAELDERFHLIALEKSYQALTEFYYYDEALRIAKRALKLAANVEDPYSRLDISVDIAQIQDNANYFRQSIETLQPIESEVLDLGEAELIQRFYTLLTKGAEQLPDAQLFEYARQKWYEFGIQLPDELALDFYFDYAQVLINLNQTEQALMFYDQAEEIAKKYKWPQYLPHITVEKAICDARLNRYESCYLRLETMGPPKETIHLYATYLNQLADSQQELGMEKEAKANYNKAIDLISQHPYLFHYASSSFSNLGLIEHANKNYLQAEALYLKGLETDQRSGIVQQEITSLYNLGVLYVDWNQHKKAEPYLWEALQLISNTYSESNSPSEQKYISDEWFIIIELLVEVLVVSGDKWDALRLLLNKDATLSGLNRKKIKKLSLPKLHPKQLLMAYSGIRQERIIIFQLYLQHQSQAIQLKTKRINLHKQAQTTFSDALLKAVERFRRRMLKNPGERDKSYQSPYPWMIRYAHFLASLPDRFQTPQKIELREELFRILANVLLPPSINELAIKQLIISPNYILGTLPFSALYIDPEKDRRLIEVYDLSLFGGIGSFQEATSKKPNALIFGATQYAHATKLTDLPAGEVEIQKISKLFPSHINLVNDSSPKILEKVNEEISKTNPTFLHFIGHAENRYPESVLHYPNATEGVIPVSDLAQLNLSDITIYISACSSADGSAYAGWGIDSVTRAFFSAGAANVISMLFPLSDRLSPLLVHQFYQHLNTGMAPETALAKVQRACIIGELGISYSSIQCWGSLLCVQRFVV